MQAARLEAEGGADPLLLRALRTKDSTVLRKRHLLTLCRAWGYRADCWVRREAASAVTPQAAQPPQQPGSGAAVGGGDGQQSISSFLADTTLLVQLSTARADASPPHAGPSCHRPARRLLPRARRRSG